MPDDRRERVRAALRAHLKPEEPPALEALRRLSNGFGRMGYMAMPIAGHADAVAEKLIARAWALGSP